MSEIILGIDLGTTNSEVAIIEEGQAKVLHIQSDEYRLPSVVGLSNTDDILVGLEAKNQQVAYPEKTISSIKRDMGRDKQIILGKEQYSPQEISSIILKKLKKIAEDYLGKPVSKAVITVPAYFSDAQRHATEQAGHIAGLDVVRMINEPTAAALAYEATLKSEKKVLIYDLGGGTFDVSIVSIADGVTEVLATHGNNHLGGDDFDHVITEKVLEHLKEAHGCDLSQDNKALARISRAAENAKIRLSSAPYVTIEEEYIAQNNEEPIHLSFEIERETYETWIEPFMNTTFESVNAALEGAQLSIADIDEVILVGGSTRTPLIAKRFEKDLNITPKSNIHPDLCVAMGAAIQGAVISGQSFSSVLIDVTPYTFGTSSLGEIDGEFTDSMFTPIIKKNTPIPVTKSESFFTTIDNQQQVEVKIFQGDDPDANNNIEIGRFMVSGLSKAPAGNPLIFELHLDLSGVLKVTAKEKKSRVEKSITISNAISQFGNKELDTAKDRINALLGNEEYTSEHSESSSEQITLVDEVELLMEKARARLEQNGTSDDDKEDLINLIESISDAKLQKDHNHLNSKMQELTDILYYLEDA